MPKLRKCKRSACGKKFVRKYDNQIYCSPQCREREAQRRLRERAKMATEYEAANNGVMGEARNG